jgi:serine/threonine protein kinase
MHAKRWQQVEAIYHDAVTLAVSDRAAFVERACGDDADLRREVLQLLHASDEASEDLAAPLIATARHLYDIRVRALIGRRLGNFEITAWIGAGGMGEVYRARDTKLNRDVALKILPDAWSFAPDRIARFKREAQVLASLNHPHIGAIYGFEDATGVCALVLEFVDGPTLAERIAAGPIPVREALVIARQIADALESAHNRGIVHRDLKPTNINLRIDGVVKVLDFGLAKILADEAIVDASLQSPAKSVEPTRTGVVLGTSGYMSPEQARGSAIDQRVDIWAFGCVLYEMLTGRSAFRGATVSDTIANVLAHDPAWGLLPSVVPRSIRRLLGRCLQKDVDDRCDDIAAVRQTIEDAIARRGRNSTSRLRTPANILMGLGHRLRDIRKARAQPAHPEIVYARQTHVVSDSDMPAPLREWLVRAVAFMTLAAVAALAIPVGRYIYSGKLDAPEMRLLVNTPPSADPSSFALSPDGRHLVYSTNIDDKAQLWNRPLDSVTTQPLVGTDRGIYPFWSPDSRTIGFFADGQLKLIDATGRTVQTIAQATTGLGGTWNQNGIILFAANSTGPILRVARSGGALSAATRLMALHSSHRFPQFLPDGRHFLLFVMGSPEARGVYIGALDSSEVSRLVAADSAAVYVNTPPGFVLFTRQGALIAQGFDGRTLKLVGDPMIVAEHVAASTGSKSVSSAARGTLAYRTTDAAALQLEWVDRTGKLLTKVGDSDATPPLGVELSSDGTHVALDRGNTDIWLIETTRNVTTRFTFGPASDILPIWSPDGRYIVFSSSRRGTYGLYQKSVIDPSAETLLLATAERNLFAEDWSPDGRFLLYRVTDATGRDLWALPLVGGNDRKPFPVVQTEFDEREGQFSPDGKWIAYASNRSGRFEIYVQPFPGQGGATQVSIAGGVQPRWRRNGKELFYIAPGARISTVSIAAASGGQSLQIGEPVELFASRIARGGVPGGDKHAYAVAPDGQRFLIEQTTDQTIAPVTIVLNWHASK